MTKKPQIKAIIFDIGGVQYFYDHMRAAEPMSKLLGIPKRKIFKTLSKNRKFVDFCEEDNPPKEYWQRFAKILNLKKISVQKMSELWDKIFWPNKEVLRILPKLKKQYKLGLISNLCESHKKFHITKNRITKPFDVSVFSCDVGIRKPNKEIYRYTLRLLKIKPEEAIFIDDFKRNIKSARKLGIKGIVFKNNKQLFKQLEKIGVK